ncbi:MAG TPA: DUF1080 domain-containing protein [Armatimonadota bacterium]|nr:DUF1080 domain-containing protein [Armatimonadota bacterium]
MALGYDDTPIIPGTSWHVHDGDRPQPPVITPGEGPGAAPCDATILFDGTDLSGWTDLAGEAAGWKVENGYMEVVPGTGNIRTIAEMGSGQYHVEFATPVEVKGDSQGRGNSGVFLAGQYEIQVLDCHENPSYPDGITGSVYGQKPPLANACRPPGEWSTYDIIWEAPEWDGGSLVKPAYVTVILNGVVLHHRLELTGNTSHRVLTEFHEHGPLPLMFQDHGDLVRFRNVWFRPIGEYDAG